MKKFSCESRDLRPVIERAAQGSFGFQIHKKNYRKILSEFLTKEMMNL